MEFIKVAKVVNPSSTPHLQSLSKSTSADRQSHNKQVDNVVLLHSGNPIPGTLHITPHHLIFKRQLTPEQPSSPPVPRIAPEIWITYPIIYTVDRQCIGSYVGQDTPSPSNGTNGNNGTPERRGLSRETSNVSDELTLSATEAQKRLQALAIRLRCRDFTFITFCFDTEQEARDVFDSIKRLTCGGLQKNRSIQDEKLVHAIFKSSNASGYASLGISNPEASSSSQSLVNVEQGAKLIYGAQQSNLIVDARPSVNAYAQQAGGAGSEVMDNYKFAKKEYLGIDNIHVMRKSLDRVLEAIKDSDITPFPANRDLLTKSNWLRHITALMQGTDLIVRQVALEHSHVLIHCSDGWDRTAQLAALAQICLDPYFRTLEGFMVLVEKDWISFGHKFRDRCGFLSSEKWFTQPGGGDGGQGGGSGFEQAIGAARMFFNQQASNLMGGDDDSDPEGLDSPTPGRGGKGKKDKGVNIKETSPVFLQFLDATYQLMQQHPKRFEFNERFLRRLLYHMYSCQYGTFLYNSEKERVDARLERRTRSVWDYFLARRQEWLNPEYDATVDADERGLGGRVIFPATIGTGAVRWWPEVFGRADEEMNGRASIFGKAGEPSPMRLTDTTTKTARQSPVVVEEDGEGGLRSQDMTVKAATDDDIAKSAAVLGTERATELAEEGEDVDSVVVESPEEGQDRVDEASICATLASNTTLDMSESVQVNESDSRMSSPPIISLDHTPEKLDKDERVLEDGEEDEPVNISLDGNSDPLGGHETVDVALSPSPRNQGRGIGGIGSRFSRSRTPKTTTVTKGIEELELV
ncbi:hypothetical protein TWF703_011030 [Orbilia oligospora]|uniref:Myotubularin phosphatase domain-containing protein n=1 Tax=Orbilia oligospora TaxID=2813651 RepID=A0A7C8JQU7_ORBOL|nr:hypothetical protein TWF703_011030 [Orbilia oligospora]